MITTAGWIFAGFVVRRFQRVHFRTQFRHWRAASAARGSAKPGSTVLFRATASFGKPLPLPVGEKFQNGGRSFLDRATRDVELRPVEFGTQSPRKCHFI